MSPEAEPSRTLRAYIRELVERLRADEPAGYRRLRAIVGDRRAMITLDDETVETYFKAHELVVQDGPTGLPVHGRGVTDRPTVLSLLYGRIEVREAMLTGHLDVRGEVGDIATMFQAVQLLLDASTRVPELQRLSREYLAHRGLDSGVELAEPGAFSADLGSGVLTPSEVSALSKHDLLP